MIDAIYGTLMNPASTIEERKEAEDIRKQLLEHLADVQESPELDRKLKDYLSNPHKKRSEVESYGTTRGSKGIVYTKKSEFWVDSRGRYHLGPRPEDVR